MRYLANGSFFSKDPSRFSLLNRTLGFIFYGGLGWMMQQFTCLLYSPKACFFSFLHLLMVLRIYRRRRISCTWAFISLLLSLNLTMS